MSERNHYPPGVPCWVDIAWPDVDAALAFYGPLFGWDFAGPGPVPGEPPGRYYVARVRGRDVAGISSLPPAAGESRPAWMTYIAVDSADRAVTRAREEGGTVVVPAFDAPPAGRMAVLRDPAGAAFCVWEANLRRGAQLVNEPSAWAMSALNTGDPDDAQHFYRATFGWETEPFGPDVTLFRLPRYVGGEPGQPVPRDVVAVMTAARTDPGWSVDIWVDDADAVAAKTIELGGTVEVAPREMAAFRNAVIADPQGARMSVSQLMVPAPAAG